MADKLTITAGPQRIAVTFPGELEYIPLVRKLVSDVLLVMNFNSKFTFRSELIVDEICNNAVSYGANVERSSIELVCAIDGDKVELTVTDPGGSKENIQRLRQAIASDTSSKLGDKAHGLELVKMLAESIGYSTDAKNTAAIHVVRKREDI